MGGRLLITGVDEAGRSCAVRDGPIAFQGEAGFDSLVYSLLYSTPSAPSIDGGGRHANTLDLGVASGTTNWLMIEYAPGAEFSMHHTNTVDLDTVLSGSVELILGDGAHQLGVGDCVVITGVDHAWRVGPDGCRLSVVAIGA